MLTGSAALVSMSAVYGQQTAKPPIVGFLVAGTQASHGAWVAAFVERLSKLGWTDGRNVVEYRWAAGDVRQITEFAAEFVQRKVDVIVTSAYGVVAAKQATSSIPIVFAAYGDAVANGIVESLARPGGNVTGLSIPPRELSSKRLELVRDVIPNVRRLAALVNTNYSGVTQEVIGIRAASAKLNMEANILEIQTADDIEAAMATLTSQTDALYVYSEPLTNAHKSKIIKVANTAKIPTIFGFREFVDAGGLISYGPNFIDLFARAAEFTDKILRGATPADMPIQQPVKFDLIINLKSAKALGLDISETVLTRADEVIE